MKRSQRMQVVVDIKAKQEKQALDIWGHSQRQQTELMQQINGLTLYRRDYVDKCNAFARNGVKVSRLVEFRSFIDKLDVAIAGQEKVLRRMEQDVLANRQLWERMHQRTRVIKKVHDTALKTEKKIEEKREQLEHDERASRFGRNKPTD